MRRYPLKPESASTTPICSLSLAVRFLAALPNTSTVPPSISINPSIVLNAVLLPAPFLPISPVTRPSGTCKEQSSRNLSYCLTTLSSRIIVCTSFPSTFRIKSPRAQSQTVRGSRCPPCRSFAPCESPAQTLSPLLFSSPQAAAPDWHLPHNFPCHAP